MRKALRWLTPGLALALVVVLPLLVSGAGNAEAGKAVYDKKCAMCHGKTGEGNPAIAKAQKVEFRHLGSKEVQDKKDDELKKTITEGTEKKKPVKGLSEDDLANVIAYMRTLKK